jgi:hypothetical protein
VTDEIVQRAAFLKDVQFGDRFQLTVKDEPPWLVTGREVAEIDDFLTGKSRTTIVLIGQDEDGNPKSQMAAPWVPVVIHVTVSDAERLP